ncbi:MAG: flagellar assembly protein FliH [Treponema sp.]|jgi:flagellar assembly protein FliH|nr:flagellar assembly protein FliH [Treponema sp.]
MAKAVFRPQELVALPERLIINPPTSFPDLSHLAPQEEEVEALDDVEEYKGPTADDLRREAEMFKAHWEEEKERMISDARAQAEQIIHDALNTAQTEIQSKTDEGQAIKQRAEEEAQKIIEEAKKKSAEMEKDVRKTLDGEIKAAQDKGMEEGKKAGFAEGKAEVERLISRTQTMLERAQDKRGEILAESEQEIIDLVLLISRKVIKVLSENQKGVIISNVTQALRKVKSKGTCLIRVNMDDLQLATEHKQDFIKLVEGDSVQILEDTTVDPGGCIIETDFGEIDARISSQLAELESKILEISPIKSSDRNDSVKNALAKSINRTPNLETELAASTSLLNTINKNNEESNKEEDTKEDEPMTPAARAALTASAALAALATMGTKGRRDTDKKLQIT